MSAVLLPGGWSEQPLGALCRPRQWTTIGQGDLTSSGVPVFGANGYIGFYSKANHEHDTIIITCRGATCGEITWVNGPSYVTGNAMCLDDVRVDVIDERYLYSFLKWRGAAYFISGSAQPQIIRGDVEKLPVILPQLTEQRRIAAVLDAWDHAISTVVSLDQAEHKQHRARVLSLLDSAGGDRHRLDELGAFRSAGVDKLVRTEQDMVRLLNFTDAFHRTLIWNDDLDHEVSASEREIRECNIREGDVFFTPSSETREEIGYAAVAVEDMDDAVYSYHVIRFRPPADTLDKLFSSVMFDTDDFHRQAYVLCDGSGQRYVLSLEDFRSMTVRVPSLEVQRQIGLFAEASMGANRARRNELALLRRQKRGLMQKLLTGAWRVPATGDDFAPGGRAADRLAVDQDTAA